MQEFDINTDSFWQIFKIDNFTLIIHILFFEDGIDLCPFEYFFVLDF